MSGSLSSVEGELNAIVKEYLELSGLEDSVRCFEDECQRLGKPIQDNAGTFQKDGRVRKIQNELFQHFDEGRRVEFFSAWDSYISPEVREGDSYCQKLEFQLHVHFAVFPIRKSNKDVIEKSDEAMFHFRYYLDTQGSCLSQIPEFLTYYALPFVSTPQSHQSFEHLFQESWVPELRNRLETFLWEAIKETTQNSPQPRLVQLYQCNDLALSDARSEAQSAERRLQDSERRCMVQARHLVKLQDDCEKLMKVTAELITALEAAVKGDMIDLDKVLSTCCQNFPDLFKFQHKNGTSSDRDPTIGSGSYSDSASRAQLMKDFLQQHSMELTDFTHVCLDFSKIKTDLVVQDTRSKTLLLQALRWRLTKTQPGEERDAVLSSYINNDLLGCEQPSQYRQRVLHMMRSPNRNLHQALLRFLNAFASFSLARTYLCKCPQLLAILQDNLINNRVKDSISQDMTLGIMQKLSLRHSLQTTMIAGGVVEWLVNTLGKATETLSDYGLEYGVALLMNLCLRTSGKKRCIDMAQRILQLLVDLLKLQNSEILPYVNGTLYSLLSVPEIKNKAQEMKLENTLQQLMNESSNDAQRQIEYVLKKFSIDDNKEGSASDGESDDDEDEAEIEPEIDKDDSVVGEIGELVGEKLLTSQYLGLPAAGISTQRKRDLSNAEVVPQRPSTPRTPKGGGNVGKEIRHTPEQTPSKGSHPRGGSRTLRFQGVEGVKNEKEHQSPKSRQDIHMLPTPPSVPEPGTNEYEIPKQPEQKLVKSPSRPPSSQSVPFSNNYGLNSHEYSLAFSSRPKIPRTPEPSASRPDTTPSPQPPQSCGMAQAPMSPKVAASSPPYSPHNAQNRHSGPHSRGRTTPHK